MAKTSGPSALDILREIKTGQYRPIYFLYGEENFFIDQITDAISSILNDAEKAFNQLVFFGKDADAKLLVSSAKRYPVMGERQVVILKEAQMLRNTEALVDYFQAPSPSTILLLAYRKKTVDKRTKFYKALKANATIFESKKLYENQIPAWIKKQATVNKLKLSEDSTQLMVEYIGADLKQIDAQLKKLAIGVGTGKEITPADIEKHIGINREYNVFELQKVLAAKDKKKVYRMLHFFEANPKAAPMPMLVGSLYNYFSKVLLTHRYRNQSDAELQKILGIHSSFFVKEYRLAIQNYNLRATKKVIGLLLQYDLKSKGVNSNNIGSGELMKELIYKIMN